MNVFVHSTNKDIDGTTITLLEELIAAIYEKVSVVGFGKTHFDIMDDDTYYEILGFNKKQLVLEMEEEIDSMLSEYKRYLRKG